MRNTLRDVRYGLRTLSREPGFSAAVMATLSLAIGANVAIFTIVNALLLRPLPYPDQRRIVFISSAQTPSGWRVGASHADYADWRGRARSFEAMGLAGAANYALTGDAESEIVSGARVSASMFRVIGLRPLLGRVFTDEEDRPGTQPVVVLGHTLWQRRFGGDASVVGRSVRLDGRTCTIVGVMSRDFAYPDHAELWVPLAADPVEEDRAARRYSVLGRLKPGVTVGQAAAEMRTIAAGLRREFPASNADLDVLVNRLGEGHGPRAILFAFLVCLGAGGFVLLIACANVANLLLARTSRRAREIAIRGALGATGRDIGRLLLVESLLLAVPSGAAGLAIGAAARDALLGMVPSGIPTWMRFDLDWRIVTFTCGVTLAAALAVTLSPAMLAARRPPGDRLRDPFGEMGGGLRRRMRDGLVVAEIALALVLLAGAGLMVRTFLNAVSVDPGFRPDNLLTLRVSLPDSRFTLEAVERLQGQLASRLGALPSVVDVGVASNLPLGGQSRGVGYAVDQEAGIGGSAPFAVRTAVDPGYFRTLGLPVLRGRAFDSRDEATGPLVAIVSRAIAERHWPGQDVLGRRVRFVDRGDASPWLTIVGVAGDVRYWRLNDEHLPAVYVPLAQARPRSVTFVARTAGDPLLAASAARAEVAGLDKDLPVADLLPFEEVARRSLWAERLFARLFETFGGVALVLAIVGIYGVVSYSVARRTREIGIRLALGAAPASIWRLVLGQGMRLAAVGVLAGLVGAPLVTSAMRNLLYGVTPHDAATLGGAAAVLLAVSAVAVCIPARRATRVDPLDAVRAN